MMDIFETALENEKSGEELYQRLADKSPNAGLSRIFEMLAEEERNHYEVICKMRDKCETDVIESDVLDDARDFFENVRGSENSYDFDMTVMELYEKARDDEAKDMEYYLAKAKEVSDPLQKQLFEKLAREEKKHHILLENICEFVSEPESFLEDAEFFHMEDDEL